MKNYRVPETLKGVNFLNVTQWMICYGKGYINAYPLPVEKDVWFKYLEEGLKMIHDNVEILEGALDDMLIGAKNIKDPRSFLNIYAGINPKVRDHLNTVELFVERLKNPKQEFISLILKEKDR